jgi:addiction module HigA family antidote
MSTPPPVGEVLRMHLAGLGWRQKDLAAAMGRPDQWVSEVISGKKAVTVLAATQLAAATGTTAGHWLAAQDRYRLWALSRDAAHTRGLEEIRLRAADLGPKQL